MTAFVMNAWDVSEDPQASTLHQFDRMEEVFVWDGGCARTLSPRFMSQEKSAIRSMLYVDPIILYLNLACINLNSPS